MSWKVVDLFSGCGGMSTGFNKLNDFYEIIGAVDLEVGKPGRKRSSGTSTQCNPTYEANLGISPLNADLSILEPAGYRESLNLQRGELDVLISCAPCTGFSQKNARNHERDDPRNRLVERTGDFVAELMPRYVVMENVKELLGGNQNHHWLELKKQLTGKLGYHVWSEVHDLQDFGLPQRRVRALIIVRRDGPIPPLPGVDAPKRTVRDAIENLPPIEAGEQHSDDPMHVAPNHTKKVMDRIQAIPKDGGSWQDVMDDPELSEEKKRYLLIPSMFNKRPGSFPDVYGRLAWDEPAVTITRECAHPGNGRYLHPEQNRHLTVREMALLQGFPEDYVFKGSLTAKYNQIGDAAPPLIAQIIAHHIAVIETGELDLDAAMADYQPQRSLFAEAG